MNTDYMAARYPASITAFDSGGIYLGSCDLRGDGQWCCSCGSSFTVEPTIEAAREWLKAKGAATLRENAR